MRILLAIAHFFRAEEGSNHSSTDAHRRDQRAAAIRSVIDSWRGHYGPTYSINVWQKRFEPMIGVADQLDIIVMVNGDNHLLDPDYCRSRGVRLYDAMLDNPRMLGFTAHKLFADARNVYDVFAFSEDDLRPTGGDLIPRILAFQDDHGWRRVLFPNRFEWNPRGPTLKTYIDGMLRPGLLAPFEVALPDERFLKSNQGARTLTFQRATNPHCGFFALTTEQLIHWMAQPQFGDQDCSFISPLESAATLGILKTFPIYKPFGRDMGWLEIEHLDTRFSGMNLPGRPQPAPRPG
ncbi:MAG: hypothetical protein ACK4Y5_15495 [Acetobacteraceae bacterium]|jgi:hypothetical protein